MRREVFISFILWCVCLLGTFLFGSYYLDVPFTEEIIQTAVLAFLSGSNFFYLFYILYKIDEDAAIIFTVISGLAFVIAFFVYRRFFKDIDPRVQLMHLLAALLITTGVVHLVRRRSGSR